LTKGGDGIHVYAGVNNDFVQKDLCGPEEELGIKISWVYRWRETDLCGPEEELGIKISWV
jgi:hypothetical protein